jgi:hypothetical protein
MVNKQKRAIGKRLVEGFAGGTITSREIDNDFPTDKNDPALGAIWRQLWFLWDDSNTHTLTGEYSPTPEARAMMDRCVAFLDSDLEYGWPPVKPPSFGLILCRIFRLQKRARELERRELDRLNSLGDFDVWPFIREKDWKGYTRSPS